MDLFTEQLVIKRKTFSDYLKMMLYVICGMLVCFFVPLFIGDYVGRLISTIICGACLFGIYQLMIRSNLEYEYTFTNGAFDVDRVIAAKRRKNLTSLNARNIKIMASKESRTFGPYMADDRIKKVYACTSIKDDGVYFVIYNEDNTEKMLLFNPNDEIKDGFKKFNPQNVNL